MMRIFCIIFHNMYYLCLFFTCLVIEFGSFSVNKILSAEETCVNALLVIY